MTGDARTVVSVTFVLAGDLTDRQSNKILDDLLRNAEDDDRLISYEIETSGSYVYQARCVMTMFLAGFCIAVGLYIALVTS